MHYCVPHSAAPRSGICDLTFCRIIKPSWRKETNQDKNNLISNMTPRQRQRSCFKLTDRFNNCPGLVFPGSLKIFLTATKCELWHSYYSVQCMGWWPVSRASVKSARSLQKIYNRRSLVYGHAWNNQGLPIRWHFQPGKSTCLHHCFKYLNEKIILLCNFCVSKSDSFLPPQPGKGKEWPQR